MVFKPMSLKVFERYLMMVGWSLEKGSIDWNLHDENGCLVCSVQIGHGARTKNEVTARSVKKIEKEFKDITNLVKNLISLGFNETKIFGITIPKFIDRYFKYTTPSYLFIDFNLFTENLEMFLKEFKSAKNKINNINIFLMVNRNETDYLKIKEHSTDYLDKKIIVKPIIKSHLTHLLNQCLAENISNEGAEKI